MNKGGGGARRSGRTADQGNARRGGDGRSRGDISVDEIWKEMADGVARHQAD